MRREKLSKRSGEHGEGRVSLAAIVLGVEFLLRGRANAERFDSQSEGPYRSDFASYKRVRGCRVLACQISDAGRIR